MRRNIPKYKKRHIRISKNICQRIAKERIDILLSEAYKAFAHHPERSERYVAIARKIGMKCNVSIPHEYRMMFCKNCGRYLIPGLSSRIRLNSRKNNIVITCKNCGSVKRYPYKPLKH